MFNSKFEPLDSLIEIRRNANAFEIAIREIALRCGNIQQILVIIRFDGRMGKFAYRSEVLIIVAKGTI
ncbi:hypothetical protein BN3658_00444 [Coriobacteriaceae bacterium CHKCI002]|nr:hypothetical protein BN3658_00444 [Coriobacteriaceae bacterium CHKCI002]